MARLKLREGWVTFVLLGAVVLTVTGAIQRADWADDLAILTPVTFGGLLLGLGLAKWRRLPSLLAHPIALAVGAAFIINRIEPILPLPRGSEGWRASFNFLVERGRAWYLATGTEQYADDFYLFVLGLAALMWIVAYACTWMVFRARWIWPALLLPAVVLLVNLGYAPTNVSNYLVLFVICGLLLVARFHVAEREEDWRRGGVAYPDSLGWRAIWIGIVVVVLTVGFGWGAPFAVSGRPLEAAWNRVNGPWTRLESAFNQRFGSLRGPGARGIGNFASFGDRFRLGGPLKLSRNPVLVLQADRPYYLKARTYDTFDGQGWSSNVDSTFISTNDGQQYAPQVNLPAGQSIAAPELRGTEQRELNVRMLTPKGSGLFSSDQFLNASQDTYVVMSWTQYRNEIIELDRTQEGDLPPDLRQIYRLLRNAPGPLRNTDDQGNIIRIQPSPRPGTATPGRAGTPVPTPTPILPPPSPYETQIEAERNALATRLVNVRPVVKNGVATRMIVNGQLPNYGDVEAVLPHAGLARGTTYKSTISTSVALAPDLRAAGGNYPDWVVKRYLQLPSTITPRTAQLAKDLENGQVPYDAAVSIQNWLRDNIKYNESINFPPADRDLVDYVLFDSRQGYCEYYASSMAIMLRSLGIPARVAGGFFSGEYDEEQLGYLYRESNAHLWVEVYFPNYGWVVFEPTSARPAFDREPAPPPGEDPGAVDPGDGTGAVGTGNELPEDLLPPDLGIGGTVGTAQPPSRFWQVARVVVPVTALIVGLLAALWLAGLRGLSPSGQFYARMTRSSRLAGVRPPPGATPYEWARAVGERVPDARRSLDQIADLYVREQYAGKRPTPQELRLVQRAWLSFRAALLRSLVSLRRPRPVEGGD
jgi:transglutaminase-like putative cysteine protease